MDALCQRLDMDPLEFRKRNASVTGSTMPIGTPFPAIGLTTILDRVGEHACWTDPLPKGRYPRGRGLALGYWRGTSMTSAGAHHHCRRRPADGDDGRRRPLRHAHDHGAGGGRGVRAAARRHPHPHRRHQVGRLQRRRRRQPRRAHHHGGAGGGQSPMRSASCASAPPRSCSARRRTSTTPRGRFHVAPGGRPGHHAGRADAGDADRRRRGRPRRLDQAAAGRRDRRACVRRGGRHRHRAW